MREGILRGSRYSPGNMDRESLEALFVGRHDELEDVLSRVMTSVRSPEKHYILLVGPRGSGKTHFLALAYHQLMDRFDAADILGNVVVASLNEEEWGVASYLDLVVRILRAISDREPELHAEIARIYDSFAKDPTEAETLAVALLRQRTRGKTLLLLCENLVDLFEGLGEEGQKRWRATIQEDGNWTILASTPSLFAAVALQDHPFFGFFTIRAFRKISFETGLELLARKAVHEGKTELAQSLRTPLGRARARAIHHLAAGNHRAYVVLSDFLDKESLEDLVDPFMEMVDDLTPYYQDRMRQLAPAQRKLVEFMCLEGKPSTIKEISTPCLMSHQTAAKQIGELESAGFVSRTRVGRNTFCELSEPLMRICIEVKDKKTRHFRLFVEFLRHWFTTRELQQQHAAFRNGGHIAILDRVHVEEAVRRSLANQREPLLDDLCDQAKKRWDAGDFSGLATTQQTLVQKRGNALDYSLWMYALIQNGEHRSAIAAARDATDKYPSFDDHQNYGDVQYQLADAYLIDNRPVDALSSIDRAIAVDGDEPHYLCLRAEILLRLARLEEAAAVVQALIDAEPDHRDSLKPIIKTLMLLRRGSEAEARAGDLVGLVPRDLRALLIASEVYRSRGQLDQALGLVDRVLDIERNHHEARQLRGFILFEMGNYRRASDDLRGSAPGYHPTGSTQRMLAESLLLSEDFEEAIDAAEHLLRIDPRNCHAHVIRGRALLELGRRPDAVLALDELLSTEDCGSLLGAASLVRGVGDYASAARYLDRVAELQPESRAYLVERTRLHIDEGAIQAAMDCAGRLEALTGSSLLGRLLGAQAMAATSPLPMALDKLDIVDFADFENDKRRHLEATVGFLTQSVRKFGPQYLSQGLTTLRDLLAEGVNEGAVGRILTDFIKENASDGYSGSLPDWEDALEGLALSLADLPDCNTPVKMLDVSVKYAKTGDKRHLLRLPLEQRQLLEDVVQPIEDGHAGRA